MNASIPKCIILEDTQPLNPKNPLVLKPFQKLAEDTKTVAVISASDSGKSLLGKESRGGVRSVFNRCVIEALKGHADMDNNAFVSLGELALFLIQEVRQATNNSQTPVFSGHLNLSTGLDR